MNFDAVRHLLAPMSDEQFEELLRRQGLPGVEGSIAQAEIEFFRARDDVSDEALLELVPFASDLGGAQLAELNAFLERRAAARGDSCPVVVQETEEALFAAVRSHLADIGLTAEQIRTFAGISDPRNERMFSAESARAAFAGVPVRRGATDSSPGDAAEGSNSEGPENNI